MKILILMADEFRHDAAGFAGRDFARTPCLDRLAEGAAIFSRAYTPSPVCVPARQCFATGLYPERAGCRDFGEDLAPGAATFARHFAEHGYYTVCCGKLHHRGVDQMQGWLHRIGSEQAVRWPSAFSDRMQIGRQKWRGAADVLEAGIGESPLALADDLATQGACDFLKLRMSGRDGLPDDLPLLLMVSLQQPHFPLLAPRELLEECLARVQPLPDCGPSGHPDLDRGRLGAGQGVGPADIHRATAAYAALVEMTDARFARVLQTLEGCGESLDDWLIVFCADHGDMLGEHGLWGKRVFYEGSVRVPLWVRGPGIEPGHWSAPCSLVDVFPTLCRLAGLPVPAGLDGGDLFAPERSAPVFSQLGTEQIMVCRGPWKYMQLPHGEVLFHLEEDPRETVNLASRASHEEILAGLRAEAGTQVDATPKKNLKKT